MGARRRRGFSTAFVVVLAVGIVGAGLAGWFLHRPGVTTKLRTVAPPAYSASAAVDASVYFDGVHAYFSGPAEVRAGTVVTVRLVSAAAEASAAISRLSPAPSWATLTHDIATANTSSAAMPMPYVQHVATVQAGTVVDVRLARPGLYSIWAGPLTSPATATVALATLVRVTAR